MSPVPDDYRFTPAADPQARREDVAYEYPFPPTTLAEEAAQEGYTNVDEAGPGQPVPAPRQVAGTGGGRTSTGTTP